MSIAARAAVGCLSHVSARKRARRAAGLAAWQSEIAVTRGHCRAKGCASRFGVTRVTIDYTMSLSELSRIAHVECVQCGRTWYRVEPPAVTRLGYQSVRLTIIVPGDRRLYRGSHGAVKAIGEGDAVIADPSLGIAQDAYRVWAARRDALLAAKEKRATVKRERDAALTRQLQAAIEAGDARRRARAEEIAAEEIAAAERERKGLA